MSEHEGLIRALLHDLRTPLNVVQAALPEIDVPEDDRYVGLAQRSTQQAVFALSFVQRALDALRAAASGSGREDLTATELRADVDALLDGAPPTDCAIHIEPSDVTLADGTPMWGLALGALGLLSRKNPLSCAFESETSVRVGREAPWSALLADASDSFASQRPGYAAWVLAAALGRGALTLAPADEPTVLCVNKSAS
jgi:hypothetical protein